MDRAGSNTKGIGRSCPETPDVRNQNQNQNRNPIDAFVRATLDSSGEATAEADRVTLIRRLSF